MLPGEQINENRQPQYQHQWQSNEPHRPFWGPEEDNSNFLTPQNTLLSYDSSPNSGLTEQCNHNHHLLSLVIFICIEFHLSIFPVNLFMQKARKKEPRFFEMSFYMY